MSLESLIKIINQISRKETVDDISNLVIKHIIDFFQFDYCAISLIKYLEDRIETKYIKSKNKYTQEQLDLWIKLSNYNLSSKDILVKTIDSKEIVFVKGCEIDGIKYEISEPNCPLNKTIYEKLNHKFLNRIFLAIVERSEKNGLNDKILGILETGFYDETLKRSIDQNTVDLLKIYVDNVAQVLKPAINKEKESEFKSLIAQYNNIYEPETFFSKIFHEIIKISKPSAADFIDFKYECINEYNRQILYNPKDYQFYNYGLNEYVFELQNSSKPRMLSHKDCNNICPENLKVVLAFPMIYLNTLVGIINLYYLRSNRFINYKLSRIAELISLFTAQYQKKKISKSVSQIGLTFPLFIEIKDRYKYVIDALSNYFLTTHVIIWQKITISHKSNKKYNFFIASEDLYDNYIKIGILSISPDKIIKKYESNQYELSNIPLGDSKINSFCLKNNLRTYLSIPITYQNIELGFIDVFFKRRIQNLSTEDEIFIAQIVNKLGVSIQLSTLTNGFSEISNTLLSEDISSVLKGITQKAKLILNAEPVILFISDKSDGIKFSDAYHAGHFFDERIKNMIYKVHDKEVDLAQLVLKEGTKWIESESDYRKFKEEGKSSWDGSLFEEEFWYREKIKSFAAIKLIHNEEPLGVMFVNYRFEQKFNNDLKDFINAFASLISVAIVNVKLLSKVKEQRENLFKLAEITNPGSIAIGYIHDAKHSMFSINQLISSLIYLVPKKILESPTGKSVVDSLILDTNHLSSLFTSLVKIAQEKDPVFKNESILEILEELEASFDTKLKNRNIFLEISLQDKKLKLFCDRSKILQVFINLFTNSLYALDEQKFVNKKITITVVKEIEKKRIKVTFKDNGIGINENNLRKVFNTSFSTKMGKGSGFGLLVIKRIMDTHNADIKVYSEFGKSTTFILYFPL